MIDFDRVLTHPMDGEKLTEATLKTLTRDGKSVQERVDVEITLGRICLNALIGGIANETSVSADDHLARFLLAEKVKSGKHELSAEDTVLLKARVAKAYNSPLIAGQALLMLDPVAAPAKGKKAA